MSIIRKTAVHEFIDQHEYNFNSDNWQNFDGFQGIMNGKFNDKESMKDIVRQYARKVADDMTNHLNISSAHAILSSETLLDNLQKVVGDHRREVVSNFDFYLGILEYIIFDNPFHFKPKLADISYAYTYCRTDAEKIEFLDWAWKNYSEVRKKKARSKEKFVSKIDPTMGMHNSTKKMQTTYAV